VPASNTDGSKPADLTRVEVYALTSDAAVTDEEIVRRGERIGVVDVNPPPDPDEDPDAPPSPERQRAIKPEAPNQGDVAHVRDRVSEESESAVRSYAAVGLNKRGRRGPASRRASVSLAEAPAAPAAPRVTYTESEITVAWEANEGALPVHVYDDAATETRLTTTPIATGSYEDARIQWGAERCYALRRVTAVGGLTIEGDASPPACVTLTDTFAPAAPSGLTAVGSEGAISLIWNANTERDLAGYLVLRAGAPGVTPTPVTASPIQETTFRDTLASGTRAIYTIQAVDTAGNVSAASAPIEETAR
jgi:fibronectin type 3 domain-containing protein